MTKKGRAAAKKEGVQAQSWSEEIPAIFYA
jgi:hypothetical protein